METAKVAAEFLAERRVLDMADKTMEQYEWALKHLIACCEELPLVSQKAHGLESRKDVRKCLTTFFRWCGRRYQWPNPVKELDPLPKKRRLPRVFTDLEVAQLLATPTNQRDRALLLLALHHLDVPWKPADLEQREGRIIRQGNQVYGPKVDEDTGKVLDPGPGVQIYNYVVEGSFDGYSWQTVEAKARAIQSLMKRNVTIRSMDDVDNIALTAAEAKAIASGNPDVMRSVQLKNDIGRLQMVRASHRDATLRAKTELAGLPKRIEAYREAIANHQVDHQLAEANKEFVLTIGRKTMDKRPEGGQALADLLPNLTDGDSDEIGTFRGFALVVADTPDGYRLTLKSPQTGLEYSSNLIPPKDVTPAGMAQRLDNLANSIAGRIEQTQRSLSQSETSLKTYQAMADKPFAEGERLDKMQQELKEVEKRLQGVMEDAPPKVVEEDDVSFDDLPSGESDWESQQMDDSGPEDGDTYSSNYWERRRQMSGAF